MQNETAFLTIILTHSFLLYIIKIFEKRLFGTTELFDRFNLTCPQPLVMRNGKGGTYVESYSLARNFELEEDIMETMTSNILKLVEKPIFQMLEEVDNLEGIMIRVTIKAQIDDSDITRWLNKNDNEKSILVAQNEALRKSNGEQEHQIRTPNRRIKTPVRKFKESDKYEFR